MCCRSREHQRQQNFNMDYDSRLEDRRSSNRLFFSADTKLEVEKTHLDKLGQLGYIVTIILVRLG